MVRAPSPLLTLASAARFGASFAAAVVGLDFGGAAIVAFADGSDVLGNFATNQATRVVWAVLAVGLLLLAVAVPRQTRR